MFERFAEQSRKVVMNARTKATERGDDHIGSLHLLSALTTGDSAASRVLAALGVTGAAVDRQLGPARTGTRGADVASARPTSGQSTSADTEDAEVLRAIGIDIGEIKRKIEENFGEGALERVPLTPRGPLNWTGRLPITHEARLVLAESLREARALRHDYIGAEHLLLGVLRAGHRRPRGNLHQALQTLHLDYETTRHHLLTELSRHSA
jgi:ATP-dependent Clp protease ATP-binding subunit ClpA